jgi:hypothetical protein
MVFMVNNSVHLLKASPLAGLSSQISLNQIFENVLKCKDFEAYKNFYPTEIIYKIPPAHHAWAFSASSRRK